MTVKNIADKAVDFIKHETVLSVAVALAVLSAFFVRPDRGYMDYIDMRTLSLLFCLMAVTAGLKEAGALDFLALKMLERVRGIKSLLFILVMLCFFSGMIITNDVALIAFIPFSFTVLNMLGHRERNRLLVPLTAAQTVAANLGSMLTPIGNPQNLYLQGVSGLGVGEFVTLMLPYCVVSFLMLSAWVLLRKESGGIELDLSDSIQISSKKKICIYIIAFCVCLMTVAKIIDYRISFLIVAVIIFLTDKRIFGWIDYTLLATFAAFFIFIGNMGRLPAFGSFIEGVISGRECLTGVLSSQIISNVPAALLLSGFTDSYKPLIIGVNLGGLGTLIASMASLISFKLITRRNKFIRGMYLLYFTAINILFLVVLSVTYYILSFVLPYGA